MSDDFTADSAKSEVPLPALEAPRVTRKSAPPWRRAGGQRRWVTIGTIIVLLGLSVWYWLAAPSPPRVPLDGDPDPAIVQVINSARWRVMLLPWSAGAWGRLGTLCYAHDFFAEAEICLAHAERLDSTSGRWPYLRGRSMLEHDPDRAMPMLARAAALTSDEQGGPLAVRLKYAELLAFRDQLDEAEALFRGALARDSTDPRALLGMGRIAVARGDYAQAVDWLTRSMERRGDVKATYTLLAIAHRRLGSTEAARRTMLNGRHLPEITQWNDPYLGQALGLRVGRDAQFNRASDMIRERRFIEATQRLETIIRNYPDFERAHLNLGVALIESGNPKSGESVLRAALARWPKSRELRNELGRALFAQGRTNEAETSFREVLRDDPNLPMAWFNLGQSLAKQSDWRGAADAFCRTTRLSPDLVAAHVDLGSSLLQSDRPTEAVAVFQRVLQLDPDNLQASAMLRTARERAMRPEGL